MTTYQNIHEQITILQTAYDDLVTMLRELYDQAHAAAVALDETGGQYLDAVARNKAALDKQIEALDAELSGLDTQREALRGQLVAACLSGNAQAVQKKIADLELKRSTIEAQKELLAGAAIPGDQSLLEAGKNQAAAMGDLRDAVSRAFHEAREATDSLSTSIKFGEIRTLAWGGFSPIFPRWNSALQHSKTGKLPE